MPCHIPVLCPLEPQRAGMCLLIPWPSTGPGQCLQHPDICCKAKKTCGQHPKEHRPRWAAGPALSTPQHQHSAGPCASKALQKMAGVPTQPGVFTGTCTLQKKNRSRASSQLAKKAPSGAPGSARSCHQAQAVQLQLSRGWHVPEVLVQI